MSLSSAKNDDCLLNHNNKQSAGPGEYMLNSGLPNCSPCFPLDPSISMGRTGVSMCDKDKRIDAESELMNITRPLSECPTKKYIPSGQYCQLTNLAECNFVSTEHTRLTNSVCGTGRELAANRWEWLCQDEQEHAIEPMPRGTVNTRIIVRDNHRPCVPKPFNQMAALPSSKEWCNDLDRFKGPVNIHNYSKNPRPCNELNL